MFGTEDRSIVKAYDYINRVVITLPLNGVTSLVLLCTRLDLM